VVLTKEHIMVDQAQISFCCAWKHQHSAMQCSTSGRKQHPCCQHTTAAGWLAQASGSACRLPEAPAGFMQLL
jgi:hypothetical protein